MAAWNPPQGNPPSANTSQPINIGTTVQTKQGGLIVGSVAGGLGIGNGNLVVQSGAVITPTLQVTSGAQTGRVLTSDASGNATWQAPTGTTYSAGYGLTLSGTTFSVNTGVIQNRVTGACSPGNAIRAIDANGNVTCELDDAGGGSGTVTRVDTGNGLQGGPITTSGTISINAPACAGNEYSRWTGSSWVCGTDQVGGGGGGGGVGGSGTANWIPKWTGTGQLGNSIIFESGNEIQVKRGSDYLGFGPNRDNAGYNDIASIIGGGWGNLILNRGGGRVGVGKTNPAGTFDVAGSLCISGDCRTSWPSGGGGGSTQIKTFDRIVDCNGDCSGLVKTYCENTRSGSYPIAVSCEDPQTRAGNSPGSCGGSTGSSSCTDSTAAASWGGSFGEYGLGAFCKDTGGTDAIIFCAYP